MGPMIQQMVQECQKCNGTGEYISPDKYCKKCHGKAFIIKSKSIKLPLRNGLDEGHKIQLEKKGHNFRDEKTDLIVMINLLPHRNFQRNGADLITEVTLEMYQSLFGFDKVIKYLDNTLLQISSSSKIEDGTVKKIVNKGMKDLRNKSTGDLYIKFKVRYPNSDKFTSEETETLKKILSKDCEIELEMEKNIRNNEIKTTKTILEKANVKIREESNDSDEGQPQCVQQ